MTKLEKGLRFLWTILRRPHLAGAVLHDNRFWHASFQRRFGHTRPLPVVPLSTFVPDSATLGEYTFLGGGSMITDLLLLQALASREDIETYFEIGTWRGESLAAVVDHVKAAWSLDLDQAAMDHLGFPEHLQAQMGALAGEYPHVHFLQGDSMQFDFKQIGRPIDLIFIDAKHTYDYVCHDTSMVLRHLWHEGSVIVWHDYAYNPEHVRWEVYQGILDSLPATLHAQLYQVGHTKCAMLWPGGTLPVHPARFPQDLKELWSVHIKRRSL